MCIVYLTQALDKGALGPISIMGWLNDVQAVGQDYALTSTVMYAGMMLGEPIVSAASSAQSACADIPGIANDSTMACSQDPLRIDVGLDDRE